jgi:sterol desaturase/sphingolipid hydroxylase (fatty acid hydroxylase superfamily)
MAGFSYGFLLHLSSHTLDGNTLLSSLKSEYRSHVPDSLDPYIKFFYRHMNNRYMGLAGEILLNPYFYLVIVGIFILECLIPVKKDQKSLSVGMFQDFFWFVADYIVLGIVLMAVYTGFLRFLYDKYLSFLTIKTVETWPLIIRGIVSILLIDFLAWFHHFVRHKVKLFWFFHTIHHSQREMNVFTDLRVHVGERVIALTLIFIPLYMFQVKLPYDFYVGFVLAIYTMVYHANLRTNYGFLKYFMVTPQSHRVHHSIEERHCDKNFGLIFTIWDRMFGTLYNEYDVYPDTGITDESFPLEKSAKGLNLFKNWAAQFLFPLTSGFTLE